MNNITMQKCSKCNREKEFTNEYFPYRYSAGIKHLRKECKQCWSNRHKDYSNKAEYNSKHLNCVICNKQFESRYNAKTCSNECRKIYKQMNSRIGKQIRKARMKANEYEPINPIDIFERDNWTCQICGTHTPIELRGTRNDNAPEMDHIKALSNGGSHTTNNVQCLCRRCNYIKGNKS